MAVSARRYEDSGRDMLDIAVRFAPRCSEDQRTELLKEALNQGALRATHIDSIGLFMVKVGNDAATVERVMNVFRTTRLVASVEMLPARQLPNSGPQLG